jgi:hypothetical protein
MSIECVSGFDLSYPLISRPEETVHSKTKIENTSCEEMCSGFDLSWPLMSQRPQDQVQSVQTRKAA